MKTTGIKTGAERGRFWFFIENIKVTGTDPRILLWLALPYQHRSQKVKIREIYPEPTEIITDRFNQNRVVFWEIKDIRKKKLQFYYDFEMSVSPVNTRINPTMIRDYDKSSDFFDFFTRSEGLITLTGRVRKTAARIVGLENNPYFRARLIFNWIIYNMDFEGTSDDTNSADQTLRLGKGSCLDFACLFVALCRASGIPARPMCCRWFPGGGHAFSEFFIPGCGWIPADTSFAEGFLQKSKCNFDKKALGYICDVLGIEGPDPDYLFGNLYPNRIINYAGLENEFISRKTGETRVFENLTPGGISSKPRSVEFYDIHDKVIHSGNYVFGEKATDRKHAYEKSSGNLLFLLIENKEWLAARKKLFCDLEKQPDSPLTNYFLGQTFLATGDYQKALDFFSDCHTKGSNIGYSANIKIWALNFQGFIHDILAERKKAQAFYRKVIKTGLSFKDAAGIARLYLGSPFTAADVEKMLEHVKD
ncbi:MAG: transglutaminase domain-containing protein [Candidatus Wallbacteria bacterium]|nr:transglutaminase domain-containing protein [Candidatus Wallbacteria bacterium]